MRQHLFPSKRKYQTWQTLNQIQNKYQNHPSTNIALPISNKILKANDLLLEAEFAEGEF
jgi:hypothetical protein